MLHQSVSPPHSVADSVASGLSAPKDKNCPFCNQAFTSSSLGRHLDLYIRLKNPKAPDGIHNVDEIRKMRQAITRRQARTSSLKKECSTPGSTPKPSATDRASPIAQSPSLNLLPGEMIRLKFNEPNWQSTGVINNLPPRSMSAVPQMRRQLSKHHHHRSEKGRQHRMLEDLDNGRAAELALKEVLRAVREARYGSHMRVLGRMAKLNNLQCTHSGSRTFRLRSLHAELSRLVPPYPSGTFDPLLSNSLPDERVMVHQPARPKAVRSAEQSCS